MVCFHPSTPAVMNSAANMFTYKFVCEHVRSVLLGIYLKGIAGHMEMVNHLKDC
jgi:hypothetical protein